MAIGSFFRLNFYKTRLIPECKKCAGIQPPDIILWKLQLQAFSEMRFLFIITHVIFSFPLSAQEPAFYKKQEFYDGTGNVPRRETAFITILMKSIVVKADDTRTELRSRYAIGFMVDTNGYIREVKLLDADTSDDIGRQMIQYNSIWRCHPEHFCA